MAEIDRRAGTLASAAPAPFARAPLPGLPGPEGPPEPMQQALDDWYRRQPDAFTPDPSAALETEADADPAAVADRALALHHLLAYGRLAGEREFARLREAAANEGSAVLTPLRERLAARDAEILGAAPAALQGPAAAALAQSTDRLTLKASAIEGLLADRKRAGSLAQSIALGEALLREDPEHYEQLLAEAERLTAALAPEPARQRAMTAAIRQRYAAAAIEGELGSAGDPAHAAEDLEAGRFRKAFDDDGIAAWRDLVAFHQQRRTAQADLAARDAGVAAEAALLDRLGAAERGEAPMPTPAELETAFPGEGETRRAATERNRKRRLYDAQIALQPFDADAGWIAAAPDATDRAIRETAVAGKRGRLATEGGAGLVRMLPSLAAAIEAGIEDPAKLGSAIALYRRQLDKLGLPPGERGALPAAALAKVAGQYEALATPAEREDWLDRVAAGAGDAAAQGLLRAIEGRQRVGELAAGKAGAGVVGGEPTASIFGGPGGDPLPGGATPGADPAATDRIVQGVPGWDGRRWAELATAQGVDPDALDAAELAPEDVQGDIPGIRNTGSGPHTYGQPSERLFIGPDGRWRLRPAFVEKLDEHGRKYRVIENVFRVFEADMAGDLLGQYLDGREADFVIPSEWMVSFPSGERAEATIQTHFEEWLEDPNKSDAPSEKIRTQLLELLRHGREGDELVAHSKWDGRIFDSGEEGAKKAAFESLPSSAAYLAIGSSVLNGGGDFAFRKVGDRLLVEGEVTFRFDEPYDFEKSFLDQFPEFDSAELLDLERFGGAHRFRTKSVWSRPVVAEIVMRGGALVVERIEWGSRKPGDSESEGNQGQGGQPR